MDTPMDKMLAAKHVEASLSGNDEAADAVEVFAFNPPMLRALFVVGEDAYEVELTVTRATHITKD